VSVYLNRFLKPDVNDAPHDHPQHSVSIMLHGHLTEEYGKPPHTRRRTIRKGAVVFRSAYFTHTLPVHPGERALTLYITGPAFRPLSFFCKDGRRIETHHRGAGICTTPD
jgi:hypothetical protein